MTVHYCITAASSIATAYTLAGPASGTVGVDSSPFTVSLNGTYGGVGLPKTITITPSGGGLSTPIVLTWSGTSDAKTFVLHPTSAGTVLLTITNSGGLTGPTTWMYGVQTGTPINLAWRTSNAATYGGSIANGPWVLNAANTYYQLTEDLAATATGFVAGAANVTLDLNGYTLTYNNASPISVVNSGFESDTIGATTATGWDLSGAPSSSFAIAANNGTMWDANVMRWTVGNGITGQYITSSDITLPQADRIYTASAVTRSAGGGRAATVTVQPYDSVTNVAVAHYGITTGSSGAGDAGCCDFIPTAANVANGIYLQISVENGSGSGSSITDIDRVAVSQSFDYGVIACPGHGALKHESGYTSSGGVAIDGAINLPSAVAAAMPGVSSFTLLDSAGTGQIAQGAAVGAYCYTVMLTETIGPCIVSGITTYTAGDDITVIHARRTSYTSGDSRLIQNCTMNWPTSGLNISVRANVQSCINMDTSACPVTVADNVLNHIPMVGFKVGGSSSFTAAITGNTINSRAVTTNCYGIMAQSYSRVANNTVTCESGGSGEGIYCGGTGAYIETDVEVGPGNVVTGGYVPTREYGVTNYARALRLRLLGTGYLQNINVHDNTFIATTSVGLMMEAHAGRIDQIQDGSNNIAITNNVFRAVILGGSDPGATYKAKAVCLDNCPNTAGLMIFTGNTFESDTVGLQICYADASGTSWNQGQVFVDNTIAKSSLGQTARPFTAYAIGYFGIGIRAPFGFYGTSYAGGATGNIVWDSTLNGSGICQQRDIDFGWVATTIVKDSGGNPISGAAVDFLDGGGSVLVSGTTDASGTAAVDVPVTHLAGTTTYTSTSVGPATLRVTKVGYTTHTGSVTLTADTTYNVTMS